LNAYLHTNNAGLRLITGFEGKPRLTARLCEGGAWEVGYGNTFYEDGSRVKEGDTIPETRVVPLLGHTLQYHFEPGVRDLLTVEVSPNQFSALVSFAYNCGLEALASSTLLRMVNLRRWEDAAAAFGMWIFATKNGYKKAYRGLLRRRYAEACLFLGYDWTQACSDDAIALQVKPSATKDKDEVVYKTSFRDVLAVAYYYPLPSLEDDDFFDAVSPPLKLEQPAQEASPVAGAGSPGATQPSGDPVAPKPSSTASVGVVPSAVGEKEAAAKPIAPAQPPPPTPVVAGQDGTKPKSPLTVNPSAVPYKIDPTAGLKPLEESDRWKASVSQAVGMTAMRVATYGAFGSTAKTVADVVEKDAVFMQTFTMFAVVGGVAAIGFIVKSYGDWKRKRAEEKASQGLY
jgi:lysozyme